VYVADFELWSLVFGPPYGQTPVRLSDPPVPPGGGVADFVLSPDATRAVYRSAQSVYGTYELFSVRLDGSQAPVRLHPALTAGAAVEPGAYRITADSRRVVFAAPLAGELGCGPRRSMAARRRSLRSTPHRSRRAAGCGSERAQAPPSLCARPERTWAYRADQVLPA
jgi:hypothetical protein